jgi:long-chain acyl-CoA synthetase
MLNLSIVLEDSARGVPDRDALVLGDTRLPYAAVNAIANQVANLLRSRGIRRGDRVALCCPNLPWFPMVYFGILKAGAVAVPLNDLLEPWEFAYHLDDSDARMFFCFQGRADLPGERGLADFQGRADLPVGERGLAGFQHAASCEHFIVLPDDILLPGDPASTCSPIADVEELWTTIKDLPMTFETVATDPADTAVILYGSGTSGRPAIGAELTHMNLLLNAMMTDSMFTRAPHDTYLVALPLFHSFGQSVCMNMGFLRRATLVLLPRFEPGKALALMERHTVTFLAAVPTMYWALLNVEGAECYDLKKIAANLTVAVAGGAALPAVVSKGFTERFGIEILEGYGLSETSPVAAFSRSDRLIKPGSIGSPIWGVELKLVDPNWNDVEGAGPGEIAIRGHNVMKGYHNRPDETAQVMRDGWLRTGDIGRRDEDGYYYIIDRSRDLIIRDGVTVYPREIEELLMKHPQVNLAAVVGVPHELYGEEIKAYVVPASGSLISANQLQKWCVSALPADGYPRLVEFRDRLPMTATGKILKRELA